jgi:two-component system NtrC family response regulator
VARVLVIDDDELICEMLSLMIEDMGHSPVSAGTLADGFATASSDDFDVILLDIRMPDGSGLDLLPRIRELPSPPEVIIITGLGDPDGAELAIKNGAWDYIQKSSTTKEMSLTLARALQYRQEKNTRKPLAALKLAGIIGNSPPMKACLDVLAQAAHSEANVLITGRTGTGKEVFARAIHENSRRKESNFVVVDCTALPETLVESVLFGHEKGSFTGADRAQDGLIKQAHKGTLFLDEIGELPLILQKAFLRVLQEHRFRPVGAKQEVESDFRVIAATNKDLEKMVEEDAFRPDLLFRLRTLTIDLPPLAVRREDIKELAMHHMARVCERYRIGTKGFSPEFFDDLMLYEWPGNVRELVSAIERAVTDAYDEPTLYPKHLPIGIRVKIARSSMRKDASAGQAGAPDGPPDSAPLDGGSSSSGGSGTDAMPFGTLPEYRQEAERRYLQALMFRTKGDMKEACRISGLSRSRLYALLKEHNIPAAV